MTFICTVKESCAPPVEFMPIPFEFLIDGPPVSQQARRRDRVRQWRAEVRNIAQAEWGAQPPVDYPLRVSITYFYENVSFDVDNIPKPVLDALKGMVYVDDSQISDLLCRKRDLTHNLQFLNPSPDLLMHLVDSRHVLHVAVSEAENLEVSFW